LGGEELRALRRLQREYPASRHVFITERGGPLTTSTVRHLVKRAGELAGIPFPVHPHQLRHAAGFALANKGTDTRTLQHWLGHRAIQHTVRYTELAAGRFNGIWED
jgi:type 1 fimbriae regulatory protein FimB/type 1 fimbriae regulatory protein FimE